MNAHALTSQRQLTGPSRSEMPRGCRVSDWGLKDGLVFFMNAHALTSQRQLTGPSRSEMPRGCRVSDWGLEDGLVFFMNAHAFIKKMRPRRSRGDVSY